MNHYCIERLAIFSHNQNPTSSSWETVIRIAYPDFNPDHAQLWTRSSYDHYLPTQQISSKSDQSFLRNPANKQTNKQTNRHTKVIAISRFSRDKNGTYCDLSNNPSQLKKRNAKKIKPHISIKKSMMWRRECHKCLIPHVKMNSNSSKSFQINHILKNSAPLLMLSRVRFKNVWHQLRNLQKPKLKTSLQLERKERLFADYWGIIDFMCPTGLWYHKNCTKSSYMCNSKVSRTEYNFATTA